MDSQESNIDRLIKARADIDDQLRQHKTTVTVLFTDVVGSTAYFDRYGDTAGLLLLHRNADLATSAVSAFRGSVVKTIGGSVMAEFFGAVARRTRLRTDFDFQLSPRTLISCHLAVYVS